MFERWKFSGMPFRIGF